MVSNALIKKVDHAPMERRWGTHLPSVVVEPVRDINH